MRQYHAYARIHRSEFNSPPPPAMRDLAECLRSRAVEKRSGGQTPGSPLRAATCLIDRPTVPNGTASHLDIAEASRIEPMVGHH